MVAAVLLVAIVADDPAVLRNAPRDNAPAQAALWRGDWLEVRGETAGFLKVYDHRHERPGYIRPATVRLLMLVHWSARWLAVRPPRLRGVTKSARPAIVGKTQQSREDSTCRTQANFCASFIKNGSRS